MKFSFIVVLMLISQVSLAAGKQPSTAENIQNAFLADAKNVQQAMASGELMDIGEGCKFTYELNKKGTLVASIKSNSGLKLNGVNLSNQTMKLTIDNREEGRDIERIYEMSFQSKVRFSYIENQLQSVSIETSSSKLTCAVAE